MKDLSRPGLTAKLNTSDAPVLVADAYSGFDKNWLYDGVHPDATGERFIAEKLLAALAEPGPTSIPTPATAAMGLTLLASSVCGAVNPCAT